MPWADEALRFAFSRPFASAVAVGMKTRQEIEINVLAASGLPVSDGLKKQVSRAKRQLHIDPWCEGCEECIKHCPQGALYLV